MMLNVDETLESSDWIKSLSWDLPTDPDVLEELYGPAWFERLSRLPAWAAAPAELKVAGFLKHLKGKHDQSTHGRGGQGTEPASVRDYPDMLTADERKA